MKQQTRDYFFIIFGLFTLTGAALFITKWYYSPYLFAVGTAGITLYFMTAPYQNLAFRQRRLHRINVMASVSLIASSIFMFRGTMAWVVFLMIATLLLLYTSFINPREKK